MLNIEIRLSFDWSIPLATYLNHEIENMYENDDFLYTNNVKLIIMPQEVSSLEENN